MITGSRVQFVLCRSLASLLALTAFVPGSSWAQQEEDEQRTHRRFEYRVTPGSQAYAWVSDHIGNGYLGVELLDLTPELRAHFGVSEDRGVMVSKVVAKSPAERAGIQVGDIFTEIDGHRVTTASRLSDLVRRKEEGEAADLRLWRDGKSQSYSVDVAERERKVFDVGRRTIRVPKARVLRFPHDKDIEVKAMEGHDGVFIVEGVEGALGHLKEYFDSPEWQERLEELQHTDWKGVQDRMREMEKKLKKLEDKLRKMGKNDEGGS